MAPVRDDPVLVLRPDQREALSLYPTRDSVDEAVREISSRLPITSTNQLAAALGLYRNSLLKEMRNADPTRAL
jgi:hypothetical protein